MFCTTAQFEQLLDLIKKAGYKLLGPTLGDEGIVFNELHSAKDLPIGWGDEQGPGRYRLTRRHDAAYFGYNCGPESWKKYLFPPKEKVWSADKHDNRIEIVNAPQRDEKQAFIGVRSCDMHAILILDKVYHTKTAVSERYQKVRNNTFIVAINCTTAADTCFCASMQTGPHVEKGFDIALTEVIDEKQHYFLLDIGSERGRAPCASLSLRKANDDEVKLGHSHVEKTKEKMIRKVDYDHVHEFLMESWDSKNWDDVVKRCVNCANCTLACPTCFCSNTDEIVSVDGTHVDRWKCWESCFNLSHSYVHGGCVRSSAQSRYRQWLTHKFGTWWDQFGVSGCVGCGRCITWCPVGIDVTEELAKIQKEHNAKK